MSIQDFLMRKMLQSKMKDVPIEDQEKVFAMMEKNPELFQKIATDAQLAIQNGKDQMTAVMEVISRYKDELTKLKE